jgi:hypothetical protein
MKQETKDFLSKKLSQAKIECDIDTLTFKVNNKTTVLDQHGTAYEVFFCTHRKLSNFSKLLIKLGVLIPFESKIKGKGHAMLRKIDEQ